MLPCSPSECSYATCTEHTAQPPENKEKETAAGRLGEDSGSEAHDVVVTVPLLSFQEAQQDSTNPNPRSEH